MQKHPRRPASLLRIITASLSVTLALCACATPAQERTTEASVSEIPPDQVITVRGRIRQLPDPEHRGRQLIIAHEAIPDFRDDRGDTVGMPAMTMPFPLDDPTLLDGVVIGDAIRFVFESRAHDGPPLRVTAIERLPEGTELAFEARKRERAESSRATPPEGDEETTPEDAHGADKNHAH